MKFNFLRISAVLFLLLCIFSAPSYAITNALNISESYNGASTVEFTVETSYDDIFAFAVGNNYGFDYARSTRSGWQGVVAVNIPDSVWSIPTFTDTNSNDGFPSVEYQPLSDLGIDLDSLNEFDSYYRAFVFYNNDEGVLPTGTTDGFFGLAFAPSSTFAAFRSNGTTISGDTSVVPIPSAAILLFSGLIGLVGIRRKK